MVDSSGLAPEDRWGIKPGPHCAEPTNTIPREGSRTPNRPINSRLHMPMCYAGLSDTLKCTRWGVTAPTGALTQVSSIEVSIEDGLHTDIGISCKSIGIARYHPDNRDVTEKIFLDLGGVQLFQPKRAESIRWPDDSE